MQNYIDENFKNEESYLYYLLGMIETHLTFYGSKHFYISKLNKNAIAFIQQKFGGLWHPHCKKLYFNNEEINNIINIAIKLKTPISVLYYKQLIEKQKLINQIRGNPDFFSKIDIKYFYGFLDSSNGITFEYRDKYCILQILEKEQFIKKIYTSEILLSKIKESYIYLYNKEYYENILNYVGFQNSSDKIELLKNKNFEKLNILTIKEFDKTLKYNKKERILQEKQELKRRKQEKKIEKELLLKLRMEEKLKQKEEKENERKKKLEKKENNKIKRQIILDKKAEKKEKFIYLSNLLSINKFYCKICDREKGLISFRKTSNKKYGYTTICRECESKKTILWRQNNPEKVRIMEKKKYQKIQYRIKNTIKSRIKSYITDRSNITTYKKIIGCSPAELVKHLESQFTPEMSWDNYGKYWNIDHIIPYAAFNKENENHLMWCNNYKNLRPIIAQDNFNKVDLLPNGKKATEMWKETPDEFFNYIGELLEERGIATKQQFIDSQRDLTKVVIVNFH